MNEEHNMTLREKYRLEFERKFTSDGYMQVKQKKPTPWMKTMPAKQIINFSIDWFLAQFDAMLAEDIEKIEHSPDDSTIYAKSILEARRASLKK